MGDIWLCFRCGTEHDTDNLKGATRCPVCGGTGVPADVTNDSVDIRITWHELRILTMWSEFWASRNHDEHPEMVKVVRTIAARIGAQHPHKSVLTFMGEIEELREHFGGDNVEQNAVTEKDDE